MQNYELCADMIDVVIDVSCIYGLPRPLNDQEIQEIAALGQQQQSSGGGEEGEEEQGITSSGGGGPVANQAPGNRDRSTAWPSVDLAVPSEEVKNLKNEVNQGGEGGGDGNAAAADDLNMQPLGHDLNEGHNVPVNQNNNNSSSGWAFDSKSSSVIKLSNGMVLFLREVNSYLALVCILNADTMLKKGLIDYNIDCFKKGLADVFLGGGGCGGGGSGGGNNNQKSDAEAKFEKSKSL
jgi:hypothetical protein